MRVRLHAVAALFFAIVLVSCSDQPKTTQASGPGSDTAASTATAPVSGKTALWEIYKTARTWAPDLTPLSLESKSVAGMQNEEGKAMVWSATFGSLAKHEARTFTYAVAAHPPDIVKGVSVGRAMPWSGPTTNALIFSSSDVATDSDAAFKTASAQASAWLSKHPKEQATLALGNASRFPAPVWYVLWGDTKKSGYVVYVNAKTGAVVK